MTVIAYCSAYRQLRNNRIQEIFSMNWISTKKRMPLPNVDTQLCVLTSTGEVLAAIYHGRWLEYNKTIQEWVLMPGTVEITHWCELPSMPNSKP